MAKLLKDINTVTAAKADNRRRPTKRGQGLKAAAKNKPATSTLRAKLCAMPRKTLIYSGAAAFFVILVAAFLLSVPPRRERSAPGSQAVPPPAADLAARPGGFPERPSEQPPPPRKALAREEAGLPTIQSVRLHPPQPTRADIIKAEVLIAAYDDPSRITYTYAWRVNNQIVADAKGDTLNLATFKKKDLVSLTVTPYDGDKAGFPVTSPVIAVHGVPPSLELQAPLKTNFVGKAADLQLVSLHPDSEGVSFSLEAPLIPGMSIDRQTGKITWTIPPNQKNTISFGAAVEDTDKTKVTKTFELKIE